MCVSGTGPACSVTIVKVGLTIRSGGIPSASPTPLQKRVFPAPRSPVSATTSPGRSAAPSARAISRVSAGEVDVSRKYSFLHIRICPLVVVPLLAEDTPSLHPGLNQECPPLGRFTPVSYTHLRAHETRHDLVCRLLL